MKICPNCRTEQPDEAVFCPTCGKKLVVADACPECGKPISRDAAYCPHCGHNLANEKRSQYTIDDISKYRSELVNLKKKKKGLFIGGLVTLIVGLVFMFGFLALAIDFTIKVAEGNETAIAIACVVVGWLGFVGNIAVVTLGIILLIVQASVFTKKISNREKAIADFEA